MNELIDGSRSSGPLIVLAQSIAVSMIGFSCSGGSAGGGGPTPPAGGGKATLEVTMDGFRSDKGAALVGLYISDDGFPDDGNKALARLEVPIKDGRAVATFQGVPAGRVAVAVLHDEDGDKKMKTGLFGRPKEGYGVSNNPTSRFGPPSYSDAALELSASSPNQTVIKIRY